MSPVPGPPVRQVPWGYLAVGFLLLTAGYLVASRTLPEWTPLSRPGRECVTEVRKVIETAGGQLVNPRLSLAKSPLYPQSYERAFRLLGPTAREYIHRNAGAAAWLVLGELEVKDGGRGPVSVTLDREGRILALEWRAEGELVNLGEPPAEIKAAREDFRLSLLRVLARGQGFAAEPRIRQFEQNTVSRVSLLVQREGEPREWINQMLSGWSVIEVSRELAEPEGKTVVTPRLLGRMLFFVAAMGLFVIAVLVLLGVLLFRRRLSFRFAMGLGALVLVSTLLSGSVLETANRAGGWFAVIHVLGGLCNVGFLVIFWAVAESLLRDSVPGFTTSLDSLTTGRLGPRSGRALLGGLGLGAASMGTTLFVRGGATEFTAHGIRPESMSFHLPFFGFLSNPFVEGTYLAATFLFFAAVFRRILAKEKADPLAAIVLAAFQSMTFPLNPWEASFALFLFASVFLLLAFRKFGLTALLVMAISGPLLRDLLASGQYFAHIQFTPLLAGASLGVLVFTGFLACSREEKSDAGGPEGPEYVRRLEKERRLHFEMDLLSRMQIALLPERPPVVPGYDLAARTVIATEAGGDLYDFIFDEDGQLWIAAGDVAGHGYSCGIQQAMVKASLHSLVSAQKKPSEILTGIHRVLRTTAKTKLFTSLVLLRLDTKTGTGLIASAGHPFPIRVVEGRAEEIALPALPLGQGPPRKYSDAEFELPEGASIILASDGLFEGGNHADEQYGYQRARAVLEATGLWRRPAEGLVEALFADLKLHAGATPLADDTTIVVVKRGSLAW